MTGGEAMPGSLFFLFKYIFKSAGYIEDIKSGKEKFESLASQFSDCSSAKNGGDLGLFGRGTHSETHLWSSHRCTKMYTRCILK